MALINNVNVDDDDVNNPPPPNTPSAPPQTPPNTPEFSTPAQPTNNEGMFVDPSMRNVQTTDTVSGQMTSLLDANSPYLQRARNGALTSANSRGLLNSSMAVGAAQGAAIDRALPIAQQDADTYFQQGRANQDASNTFRTADNKYTADSSLSAQDFTQDLGRIGAQGSQDRLNIGAQGTQDRLNIGAQGSQDRLNITAQGDQNVRLARVNNAHDIALQTLVGSQQVELANIEANWRTLVQQNATAGEFYTRIAETISAISNNDALTPAQQQAAIDDQLELLDGGLTLLGGINGITLDTDTGSVGTPGPTTNPQGGDGTMSVTLANGDTLDFTPDMMANLFPPRPTVADFGRPRHDDDGNVRYYGLADSQKAAYESAIQEWDSMYGSYFPSGHWSDYDRFAPRLGYNY